MDQYVLILLGLIAVVSPAITLYLASKIALKTIREGANDMLDEIIDAKSKEIKDFLNSEAGQKVIYQIGGLIGAGAKDQMRGLLGGGGRKGTNGLIGDILGSFLQRGLGGALGGQSSEQQQSINTNLNP